MLVNTHGEPIHGQTFPEPLRQVSAMLGKDMAIVSKLELCGLICAQYRAIENLMEALYHAEPDNALVRGLRGNSMIPGQSGNVPDSTNA